MPWKRKTPKEGVGNSEPSPPEGQVSAASNPSGTQHSTASQQQSYPSTAAAVPRAGSARLAPIVAGTFRDMQGAHGQCNGSGQGVGTVAEQIGRGASLEIKRVAHVREASSGGFGRDVQGSGRGRELTTPIPSFYGMTPARHPVVAGGPKLLPDLPQAVASQAPAPYSRPASKQVGQCEPFIYGGINRSQAGAYYMSPLQQYTGSQQVQPTQFAPDQQSQSQFTGPPSHAGVRTQYLRDAQLAHPQYIAGQASQTQYLCAPQVRPPFTGSRKQQPRAQPGVPRPLYAGAQRYIGVPQVSYAHAQPVRSQASFTIPPNSSSVIRLSQQFEKQVKIQDPLPNAKHDAGINLHSITLAEQRSAPQGSSKSVRFSLRPGMGRTGINCIVKANHFFAELPDKDLHQYDVTITPEVTSRGVNRAVMEQLVKLYRYTVLGRRLPAYDGRKSLYTAGGLPFQNKEFSISLPDEYSSGSMRRERVFKVVVKFAARVDLHHLGEFLNGRQADAPQEALQVLDIVLRELPTHRFSSIGRSFYSSDRERRQPLGWGLESWKGFYQSIRPTQMGLSLNIDMSSTVFIEALPVIEFVSKLLNKDVSRHLSDADRKEVKKALRGVKVEVTHRGNMRRKYRISGLTLQSTQELTFPVDDNGTKKSVVEYFRETYGYLIRCVGLPCLQVGNQQRPIYLPMEVCKIVSGQRYSKRLNKEQMTKLLNVTCQRPSERERDIMETFRQNSYAADPYAREFGIKISAELASVKARILPAPQLKYHDTGRLNICQPEFGKWDMRDKKMVNGGVVNDWACVNFSPYVKDNAAYRFCQALASMCQVSGMSFRQEPSIPIRHGRNDQVEKALKFMFEEFQKTVKDRALELLIAILPDNNGTLYGELKRICETDLGLVSQCCLTEHVGDINKQYLANVALKINAKVGGRNTVLVDALSRRMPLVSDIPTIIFGADVTHPHPGEASSPSIAAVVASQDWPEVTKYASLVCAQEHRQELIQDLFKSWVDPVRGPQTGGMIKELLISFRRATGQRPLRIIFYRDGVSEGQFYQVLLHELEAIRKACASLEPNYQPPVTFVVVQKRHHTRFFAKNHNDRRSTDKSGNILPGTVVDSSICHPTEFDFYLCSHAGTKGTSRPAHYHVLWDENNFTADGLQLLTNNLCYTNARCTRAVSIVPPACYAHLAAFRARFYMGPDSESGSLTSGIGPPGRSIAAGSSGMRSSCTGVTAVRPLPAVKDNVKQVMFYC